MTAPLASRLGSTLRTYPLGAGVIVIDGILFVGVRALAIGKDGYDKLLQVQ